MRSLCPSCKDVAGWRTLIDIRLQHVGQCMITSWYGNAFRITGSLRGESTDLRWSHICVTWPQWVNTISHFSLTQTIYHHEIVVWKVPNMFIEFVCLSRLWMKKVTTTDFFWSVIARMVTTVTSIFCFKWALSISLRVLTNKIIFVLKGTTPIVKSDNWQYHWECWITRLLSVKNRLSCNTSLKTLPVYLI